jgi:hypothetical protein
VIGNGDAMRVAAQVAEQLGGFAEGWLGVNDPLVRHARFITAVVTHVDVSAERGGTATADSPERLQLLIAEAGLIIGRPVNGGYQRPPWRSGSWLLRAAEGMAALVDVRQREFFEWVMHQLQVPLGEVEIFSGCLQIAESEWCADQFQLQADGWPSCGACAFLGCKQVSEREFNLCGCSQPRESQIGI